MDAAKGLLVLIVAGALGIPSAAVGQSGWSGGTSNPATYDRYSQPIAPTSTAVAQRAQTAFNDTSSALRDGFNAGVRAAEESFNNATGNSGSAPLWSSSPAVAPPAPPVWPSNQPAAASTARSAQPAGANGWSSINANVAAPPLLVPNSPMQTPTFGSSISAASRPTYPSVASNDTQPLHSVLKDPATSSTNPTASANTNSPTDWSAGWSGDNNASKSVSNGRQGSGSSLENNSRDGGLVPLQGSTGTAASDPRYGGNSAAGSSWSGADSWSQNQPPSLGAANGTVSVSRQNTTAAPGTTPLTGNYPQNGQLANQSIPQFTGQQAGQNTQTGGFGSYANYNPAGSANAGMPNQQNQMSQTTPGAGQFGRTTTGGTIETPPWLPLTLSVMGLAASLAANLYLGVSYLDARQKYQSLVRKTAETFRRVKAVAA